MTQLEQVLDSVHRLSAAEKRVLHEALGLELAQSAPAPNQVAVHPLVGLLADEPELADAILQSAMTARQTRPLRTGGG